MIVQTAGIPDKSMFKGFEFTDSRFLHDRKASIGGGSVQPVVRGGLNGRRQVFILYFQLNKRTESKQIRLRILKGKILNASPAFERGYDDEMALLNVDENIGKRLFLCFDCNPIYGSWALQWGNENGWWSCPAEFDFLAFIHASKPLTKYNMELPRFNAAPVFGFDTIGQDLRGSVGQPYGRTIRQMRTMSASFTRIDMNAINNYYNLVSISEPHFVVPYPEEVEHFPPMWATLAQSPDLTKRVENKFLVNFSLAWKEAY